MNTTDQPSRLKGLPLILATLAVASASFMNTLDTTIAIVALPTIAGNLSATPSQGAWVITTYAVCLAVILPLSGWITRRFGEVNTFTVSVLLFTVASWLCGISASFNQLLLFRALQGVAGGLLLPLSQSLLMRLYPPEKHGLALGIWGITTVAAPVVGPVLGGYITDGWGWPWIFYINIPIGATCLYLSWTLLRPFESATERVPVDIVGLVLLVIGVICFQLMLDRGHELDWLSSRAITAMLIISIVCFFLFLAWERDEAHPVVDLSLFAHRNFVIGTLMISIMYTTFMVNTVIYPIWLQTSLGYTASWSGLVMSPSGLFPFILMPLLGQRLRLWDTRRVLTFGFVILAVAFYLHAGSSTQSPPWYFVSVRLVIGLAIPFAMMPLLVTALVGLPAAKLASAAGIFNFARMLSSSLGTAAGITLWDQRAIYHRSQLVEDLAAESPQYQQTIELLLSRVADNPSALAVVDRAISIQARTLAMNDLNYLCAVIVLAAAGLAWLLPSPAAAEEAAT